MNLSPKSRTDGIVVQETKDEIMIYDLERNKAVCLNQTAGDVWKLCNGKRTISEIAQVLSEKENHPVSDQLVLLAVEQLKSESLFSNSEEIDTSFDGLSRRDIVRKVGVASMIALPIVSSIVAPTAIAAQSIACFAPGTCIAAGDDLCNGGCMGTQPVRIWTSTDGSCTGTPSAAILGCTGPVETFPSDIQIV